MSAKFDRLIQLLRELFQLDQPDLDFGLYRIMHAKSAEVTQFLERDLLPQVKQAFEQYQPGDKAAVKQKLDEAIAAARSLGVDPDSNQKVQELRRELEAGVDISALEDEVYDHLFSFFRRYYSDGDFLAKRVYKPGVYAVPYEGEEVVLHWANKDQYYIKTSEYLRDYAFRLKPEAGEAGGDPKRVHFRLVAAAEGEHGNNKAAEGKDRVFVLAPAGESGHNFLSVETVDGREELVIGFEYRPATMDDWTDEAKAQATAAAKKKPPKQKDLIDIAVKIVLAVTGDVFDGWVSELAKPHTKVNGETADYSRLEGHLNRYCKRHQFDYFIHKDLGGFLRRELDFYIKNDVMHLDDIQNEDAPKVEQYLSKIKVIRTIAGKVIDFLHQLEEFQRKLWLKKKFVTETFYCIRLGVIPEDFYAEIAANQAQHNEWVKLCAINKIKGDLTTPSYSKNLKAEFLKAHPTLMVDTRHFSEDFVARLLSAFDDLDEYTDGLAIHSDNFHALRLLGSRYRGQIDCIYIDPPYNTDASPIIYKNGYRRSSWASLMLNRLECAQQLRRSESLQCIAIDDFEYPDLQELLGGFGVDAHHATAAVRSKPQGRPTATGFSANHEYATFWGPETVRVGRLQRSGSKADRYPHSDDKGIYAWANFRKSGTDSDRDDRRRSFYPMIVHGDQIRVAKSEWIEDAEEWRPTESASSGAELVWPIDSDGNEKVWTCSPERAAEEIDDIRFERSESGSIEIYKKYRPNQDGALPGTWWDDAKYSASESGTKVLKALFGTKPFDYPKSVHLVADCIRVMSPPKQGVVLDYFAGSGTTAHAIIAMNRDDDAQLRFVLADSGEYFDEVIVARLKKVSFAPEWSAKVPVRMATDAEAERSPRIIKCVRLETYEDAIRNIVIQRGDEEETLLLGHGESGIREDYVLRYMLTVESRESLSLLSVARFVDPTSYALAVKDPGTDETRTANIDLLETFSWLLGIRVANISKPQTFAAATKRDSEGRLTVKGRIKVDPNGPWWFRTVTGTTPDGKRALIIWRKRPGGDEPDGIEQDNAVLDAWFRTQGYSTTDSEFDVVWVNGDSNLANLRQEDAPEEGLRETGWKVRVIEHDFHRLMFDTSDVPGGA